MKNKWLEIAASEKMDSDPGIIEFACGAVARHIGKQERVLDIGCGNGVEMSILARDHNYIEGIDISEKSLAIATAKGYKVKYMDMHKLNYKDNSFDLVFMKDVFEHSVSHIESFSEACRVGRYVAIILPDESWQSSAWHYIIPNMKQMISLGMKCDMSLRAYEEYSVVAGFRVIGQRIYIYEKNKSK